MVNLNINNIKSYEISFLNTILQCLYSNFLIILLNINLMFGCSHNRWTMDRYQKKEI